MPSGYILFPPEESVGETRSLHVYLKMFQLLRRKIVLNRATLYFFKDLIQQDTELQKLQVPEQYDASILVNEFSVKEEAHFSGSTKFIFEFLQ